MRNTKTIKIAALTMSAIVMSNGLASELKVGIYNSGPVRGIYEALEQGGMQVKLLDSLDADTLFNYDVIFLGSLKGLPQRSWCDDLQIYAECGGGVMLCHDSVGFRGWDEPLFPTLFRGSGQSREATVLVAKADHSVIENLPEEFAPMYMDHILITPEAGAMPLIHDQDGQAVVVAARAKNGRVIGCGLLPGLAYIRSDHVQKPPEGAEKQFLIQAVRWLGETPITKAAPDELLKLRQQIEKGIILKLAAEVVKPTGALEGSADCAKAWFDESRINEQSFVHPPVTQMPGRFFTFDDLTVGILNREGRGRAYGEIILKLKELKWSGITDVVTHGTGPLHPMVYRTDIPGMILNERAKSLGFDYLEMLTKACQEVGGLNVWVFWHSNVRSAKRISPQYQDLLIRDPKGELYGPYIDVNNPQARQLCRRIIDELAVKYNKHGNIKGILLDEFWHPFCVDFLERYVPEFIKHCEATYREAPPNDIAEKFALGPRWHEPENVWWRRYMLWRNSLIVDFFRDITGYANSKGFQVINMPLHAQQRLGRGRGWFWGYGALHDLAQQGDMLVMYQWGVNAYFFDAYPRDRIVLGMHYAGSSGYQQVLLARGCYGFQFVLSAIFHPIANGVNPRLPEVFARQVRANREWFGAEVQSEAAVLTNVRSLDMQCLKPAEMFQTHDRAIRDVLGERCNTSMLMVEDTRYYGRYKALIAPLYSLNGLSVAQEKALYAYIENGGCLIVMNGMITTGEPDFTNIKDRTAAFTGLKHLPGAARTPRDGTLHWSPTGAKINFVGLLPGPWEKIDGEQTQSIATNEEDGHALISERAIGKGKVLTVCFDVPALMENPKNKDSVRLLLGNLLQLAAPPKIHAEGDLRVISSLKKGNWAMISLMGREVDDRELYPARGRVYFDMEKLGIKADKYRVFSLARDREMMPEGKLWHLYGINYWTASNLVNNGVSVYIAPDDLIGLDLPVSATNAVLQQVAQKWKRYKKARTYEHEILAVMPADESKTPGEIFVVQDRP